MGCMTILNIPSFDCFCTIPIVFTVVVGGFIAMAKVIKG